AFCASCVSRRGDQSMPRDPAIGSWQLSLTKSTFKLFAAPKSSVMEVDFWGDDGLKWNVHIIDAQGNQLTPLQPHINLTGRIIQLEVSPISLKRYAHSGSMITGSRILGRKMEGLSCQERF